MSAKQRLKRGNDPIAAGRARRFRIHRAGRRGVALFLSLVFLGLAAVFMASWLTKAAAERRHAVLAEQRVQAGWLAEAGVERAASQLAGNRDFRGESWQAPVEEFASGNRAIIDIKIEPAEEDTQQAIVEVQLLDGDEVLVRTRKQVSIRLSNTEESS